MPKEVKIIVREVRRKEPDLRKLARALIQLAIAEEEAIESTEPGGASPEEAAS
jgi:hypothetical protein